MDNENLLEVKLNYVKNSFMNQIKGESIQVVSHFDTDGITSAAIMIKTLKRLDQKFSLTIVKSLTPNFIHSLDKSKITLFLDLASNSFQHIKEANLRKVFIIDHHEVTQEIPENIQIINPNLCEGQKISAAQLTYLFSKKINPNNTDLAKLATIGMIGDQMEKDMDPISHSIINDAKITIKKGLLIYPSTKPLNIVLEYSSDPVIPDVTANPKGVLELLRESGITHSKGKYKSIIDLTEEEMEKLTTAIMLRKPIQINKQLTGNLFLIKMFGKLEDGRELSAKINACSRNGQYGTAIALCLENIQAKKKAESIHIKHKQNLISGIKYIQDAPRIKGEGYCIINAKDKVKDTIIGTITSIISNSNEFESGTILISMAEDKENQKIKISARASGKPPKNLREFLSSIMKNFQGEVGGHEFAAGCSIEKEKISEFIEHVQLHFSSPPIQQISSN